MPWWRRWVEKIRINITLNPRIQDNIYHEGHEDLIVLRGDILIFKAFIQDNML